MANLALLEKKSAGLYSQGNPLHGAPEGALLVADNAVIDREGIISKRRGFNRYGFQETVASPGFSGNQLPALAAGLFEFRKTLIALAGTAMIYDADDAGDWTAWTGTFEPPPGSRMRSIEAAKNFYFTASLGVFKNDEIDGVPRLAGMPQGLDIELELDGTGASWFAPDSAVAYRIIWTRRDANRNLFLGPPSTRETIINVLTAVTYTYAAGVVTVTQTAHGYTNGDVVEIVDPIDPLAEEGPHTITFINANSYSYTVAGAPANGTASAGKFFDVELTFTIPDDIVEGDTYEIYRSELSATANTDPGDELLLVFAGETTAGEISAGLVNIVDDFNADFLGVRLYTNDSQEGPSAANDRPPLASFMVEFKGHVWYAKTQQASFFELQFIDLSVAAVNDTITLDGLVYTFKAAEVVANREFKLFTAEPTIAQNIEKTAKSFIRVVNRHSTSNIYAFYISGVDDPPGKVVLERRAVDSDTVTIISTSGDTFIPDLTSSQEFTIDIVENALYKSKFQKPESVPYLNWTPVGSRSKAFLGMAATEDFLLVFKEDGLFIVSGETDGGLGNLFVTELRDATLIVTVPESIVALDNSVISYTQQGLQKSTGQGSYIISRAIEPDLLKAAQFPDFATISHCVAYESGKKLLFFTKRRPSDSVATCAYVWNYITNAWTRWPKPASCGIALVRTDRLYLGHSDEPFILEERKNFFTDDSDYMDEALLVSVTTGTITTTTDDDGNTVSKCNLGGVKLYTIIELALAATGPRPDVGWMFEQDGHKAKIMVAVQNSATSTTVTFDRVIALTAGSLNAFVIRPIDTRLEWVPDSADNAAELKQFTGVQLYFEKNSISKLTIGFKADILVAAAAELLQSTGQNATMIEDMAQGRRRGWGRFPWGRWAWGNAEVLGGHVAKVMVPLPHQTCRALGVRLRHRMASESMDIIQKYVEARRISERTETRPR